jgi:hypothetical protein
MTGQVMGLKSLGAYVTYQLGGKRTIFWGLDPVMDAYPGIIDVSFLLYFLQVFLFKK